MRLITFLVSCCFITQVLALPAASVRHSTDRLETIDKTSEYLALPYLFSTESMGLNIGLGAMASGYYQDQMTAGITAFGGDVSQGVGAGLWDYQLPGNERLFFTVYGMLGYYPDQRAYSSTARFTPANQPRAGSNDSSIHDFIEADGSSNWWKMKLQYSLPIGATRDQGLVQYSTRQGLLVSEPSGGSHWNPMTSGASVIVLNQTNRYQSFEEGDQTIDGAVHALELGFLYDNTDFPTNPSYGSQQYLSVTHDAAWLESKHKWTIVEFEASKYFSLGSSAHAHQRIVALNFWTSYSPSWDIEYDQNGGQRVTGGAPYNEGATLGGFYRLRGYDQNRFHDKASIYGAAEYRYTLKYNPIKDIEWLSFVGLDWFQLVGFVEAGRVAPKYSANELLKDMKTDYGISLRAMASGLVVRSDIATSDEGTSFWVAVDHPF